MSDLTLRVRLDGHVEEVEAYRDQWLVAFGNHPHIQMLGRVSDA